MTGFLRLSTPWHFFFEHPGCPGTGKGTFPAPSGTYHICEANRWIPCVNTRIPKKGEKTLGVTGQKGFGPDLLAGGQVVAR